MSADDDPVTVLSEDESWGLLSTVSLGRLVTILGGQPEIFPVNFVTQRRTVLFRTAQGTKLFGAVMSGRVAFEADDHTVAEGWSVIVKGTARQLSANADILDAQERAVAAVDRDVEACLRTGDRHGDHRPAVQVRSRTGPRIHLRLMTAARRGQRNRHTTSGKCIRSRDFRPCDPFHQRPTVTSTTFRVARTLDLPHSFAMARYTKM